MEKNEPRSHFQRRLRSRPIGAMAVNMRQWFSELDRQVTTRPAMPILTSPGLQLLAGKNVQDLVTDPEVQCECILKLAARYPSIAAMTVMDLSIEAEAFGCPVVFSAHEVPTVSSRIVKNLEEAESLRVPEVRSGRTRVPLETVSRSRESITDRPLFGGVIGPYSLAARIYDMTEIMTAVLDDPEPVHVLLEKCSGFLASYIREFKQVGADGIIMAEPAAGLLSPDLCDEFSSDYVRRIVEQVQSDEFAVILHNCGNTTSLVGSMVSTGARGFHFGNAVDMTAILPQVPAERIAFGNIDPVGVFLSGSEKDVETATRNLLEKTQQYTNYVISSGCDVPSRTPLGNVDAFYRTVGQLIPSA